MSSDVAAVASRAQKTLASFEGQRYCPWSEALACRLPGSPAQYVTATSVSNLLAILQGDQVTYNITLAADMHLNPQNWPNTVSVTTTIFLQGDTGDAAERRVLDWGNIVNAIQVQEGATLGFQDLLVTGMPWDAEGTNLTAGLPECVGCNLYPSVIFFPNSTLVSNSTEYEIDTAYFNITCETIHDNYLHRIGRKWPTVESANGVSLTIVVPADEPIVDKLSIVGANGTESSGTDTLILIGNMTQSCYDTPAERPHVINSAISLDEPGSTDGNASSAASLSSGSGSGKVSTGAIAGAIVGSVVGATLLATLGFFVLRKLRRIDTVPQDMQATDQTEHLTQRQSVSGSASTSTGSRQSEPQWYFANPLLQLEAAAQVSSRSCHSSSKVSGVDDGSSVGQLSGVPPPAQAKGDGCTMQFDWHIQPHRLAVVGGREAMPIGIGAYGVVYKGVLDGFKPVAIKFLHPATCPATSSHTARFMEEVNLLRACKDRNVVELKGAWAQQDLVYMVLELMETDLLRALSDEQIGSAKLPPGKRVLGWYNRGEQVALDILHGLHYLHSNNVVHLDMKSANILLAHDKTAKIADVGLASTLSKSALSEHHRGGTLAWQSPEMLMGRPASFSADMWSFGVILLEIVTGQLPQRGRYAISEVPEECPQAVADLIKRCMASVPEDRPTALEAIQIVMASTGKPPSTGQSLAGNET
ncbi:hypothetical protein WJX73_002627 [Symbiochloris irregularis]|uniref:Protein kinase domain-containing protein n=1 Tax=Symbiochloris irregularis TaxID=706552 RepID=A0AAW1PG30_9CHLO